VYARRDLCKLAGDQLSMSVHRQQLDRSAQWLGPMTLILTMGIASFAFGSVLALDERWMRMASGVTPAVLGLSFALLTERSRTSHLRFVAVALSGLSAVFLSWADMQPDFTATGWLIRLIRVIVVSAVLCFLFGVVFARRLAQDNLWRDVMWKSSIAACGLAALLLLLILPLEASVFEQQRGLPDEVDVYHVGAVSVSFAFVVATLLLFALVPGRDPFALSERGKMAYVYAAEFVGLLLFVHIYLAVPELFSGVLRDYWPFIVMGIAFAGVGFSELARRSGNRVLSEPLYHTGALMPLLPALGVWVVSAETDYSLVMFTAGLMYLMLAMMRDSVTNSLVAIVAGNVALWSLLGKYEDWSLLAHPQFWLIPPALSVLIAAHVNQASFTRPQLAGIRYLCMIVIYISSTAEMFTQGIGDHLWPPMVLAMLAVLGALIGIAFRIRAFLYTGSSFVLLAVFSMVWHAYARLDHAAVWWAFGITLGLAILALFAFFEKNRPAIHTWINQMRQWEQ
jgi:hypothetical protein